MKYRFLEHTADVRAECEGATFAQLLEAAAHALYAAAFQRRDERATRRREIRIESGGAEETLVRWLQELIYLMEAEQFAAVRFSFAHAEECRVEAVAEGCEYAAEDRADEIKAATYHGMTVRHDARGWHAEVLFDV